MPKLFDFTTEKNLFADETAWFTLSSLFHMGAGYAMGWWGLSFIQTAIIHALFEVWEGSKYGVAFFNLQIFKTLRTYTNKFLGKGLWNGYKGDTWENCVGDNISAWVGWWLARGGRDF